MAASIGNAIEWFDYSTYGYLATIIGRTFFPSGDPVTSLLSAFAVFAAAFLMRPVGGIVFGSLGDRVGRRTVLAITVIIISGSVFCVGLLPGYQAIGVAAPALLLVLRLVQALSAGGEVGGSVIVLAEYAPTRRRGFFVGFHNVSGYGGALVAAVVVTALTWMLGPATMADWGWRIPFLVAGPIGVVGLYLRLRLEDTPEFVELREAGRLSRAPMREACQVRNAGALLRCAGLACTHMIGYYMLLTYIPNWLQSAKIVSSNGAFLATTVMMLASMVALPIAATLSDRFGRRPVTMTACIGYIVLSWPLFTLMASGLAGALVGQAVFGLLLGIFGSAPFAMMVELFTTRLRYSGFSLAYNASAVVFGGTAPLLATWVVVVTGLGHAPAIYLVLAGAVGLVSAVSTQETARRPLRHDEG